MLRKRRNAIGALLLSGLTALALGVGTAKANTELFTTQDDFSQWSNTGNFTTAASGAFDSDGSSTNGLGNSSAPGATGTPGSLSVTATSSTYGYFYGPGENAAFATALAPNGTLSIDYTLPANNGGSYFELGVVLNYQNNFGQFFQTASPVSDGNNTFTVLVPYTLSPIINLSAGTSTYAYSYFQPGLIFNSNYDTSGPTQFYVDNIQLVSVPEPATVGLLSGSGLLALRRRRR
jgi:PEP-CTERM motif